MNNLNSLSQCIFDFCSYVEDHPNRFKIEYSNGSKEDFIDTNDISSTATISSIDMPDGQIIITITCADGNVGSEFFSVNVNFIENNTKEKLVAIDILTKSMFNKAILDSINTIRESKPQNNGYMNILENCIDH